MKYLRKTWIRVLVSLIGGGMSQEIFFLSNGDPNRSRVNKGSGITLVVAVIIFIILTYLVNKDRESKL